MKIYPNPQIAENLRKLLYENDMTQVELARILGVERKCICNWCNCIGEPRATHIRKICAYFKISADDFLDL